MEGLKQALVISVGSRAFAALLGFLALPLYLRFLGIEAYGVIGLFVSVQALTVFMDFGIGATLTRQLSAAGSDDQARQRVRDTTLTFELVYLILAVATGLLLAAVAPLIGTYWVNPQTLSAGEVTRALQLAAVSLACGWPANLYGAGLAGLHRQRELAHSTALCGALKMGLSVLFISYMPTLEAFFLAQIAAALIQSVAMRIQVWRALPRSMSRARIRWSALSGTWRFAGGMTAITVTSLLLTQMDRLVLSFLLELPDFGIYAIAATLAGALYILISPTFLVLYPRMTSLLTNGDTAGLTELYQVSCQAMAALVVPLGVVIATFPAQALYVLTGDIVVSRNASQILAFLVIGTTLNGVLNVPYALQLAAGWTSLTIKTNIVAVLLLCPATWLAAKALGPVGGAMVWCCLNLGYFLLSPHFVHARLLPAEKWRWYLSGVLLPGATCLAAAGAVKLLSHDGGGSRWTAALQLGLAWLFALGLTVLSLPRLREQARVLWRLAA